MTLVSALVSTLVGLLQEALTHSQYLLIFLSSIRSSGLSCVFPSLMGPRKAVDFSDCSAFYLLLEWNGMVTFVVRGCVLTLMERLWSSKL